MYQRLTLGLGLVCGRDEYQEEIFGYFCRHFTLRITQNVNLKCVFNFKIPISTSYQYNLLRFLSL